MASHFRAEQLGGSDNEVFVPFVRHAIHAFPNRILAIFRNRFRTCQIVPRLPAVVVIVLSFAKPSKAPLRSFILRRVY